MQGSLRRPADHQRADQRIRGCDGGGDIRIIGAVGHIEFRGDQLVREYYKTVACWGLVEDVLQLGIDVVRGAEI